MIRWGTGQAAKGKRRRTSVWGGNHTPSQVRTGVKSTQTREGKLVSHQKKGGGVTRAQGWRCSQSRKVLRTSRGWYKAWSVPLRKGRGGAAGKNQIAADKVNFRIVPGSIMGTAAGELVEGSGSRFCQGEVHILRGTDGSVNEDWQSSPG